MNARRDFADCLERSKIGLAETTEMQMLRSIGFPDEDRQKIDGIKLAASLELLADLPEQVFFEIGIPAMIRVSE